MTSGSVIVNGDLESMLEKVSTVCFNVLSDYLIWGAK